MTSHRGIMTSISQDCLQAIYAFPTSCVQENQTETRINELCGLLHDFTLQASHDHMDGSSLFTWAIGVCRGNGGGKDGSLRVRWFPKYGCALVYNTTSGCLMEPQVVHIDVIGLDHWHFKVHGGMEGRDLPLVLVSGLL